MVKKKRNSVDKLLKVPFIVVIFLGSIFLGSIFFGIFLFLEDSNNEDESIEAVNYCWNESKVIGRKNIGEPYNITTPYRIAYWKYYDFGIGEYICMSENEVREKFPECNSDYCEYSLDDGNYKVYREQCTVTRQETEDILREIELCELRKVVTE